MATSTRKSGSRQLTFLSAARRASPSASKGCEAAWLILVGTSRFDSVRSLASFVHGGSSGKTSPTSCELTGDGLLVPSSGGWLNSGMGSRTAFLTLDSSESRNAAEECSLSDIIETGSVQPELCLSLHNISRMQTRLAKYAGADSPLLGYLNRYSDGTATRLRNSG